MSSSSLTYRCPHCNDVIEVRSGLAEEVVNCPSCDRPFHAEVPDAKPLSEAEQREPDNQPVATVETARSGKIKSSAMPIPAPPTRSKISTDQPVVKDKKKLTAGDISPPINGQSKTETYYDHQDRKSVQKKRDQNKTRNDSSLRKSTTDSKQPENKTENKTENKPDTFAISSASKTDTAEEKLFEVHPVLRANPLWLVGVILLATLGLLGTVVYLLAANKTNLPSFVGLQIPDWDFLESQIFLWLSVALLVGSLLALVLQSRRNGFVTLTVTPKGCLLHKGSGKDERTVDLRHEDIQTIAIDQSTWERLLNVGSVGLSNSDDSDYDLVAKGIPNPQRVVDTIREYQETAGTKKMGAKKRNG